jgi:ribosomal-protein-alanine acetyltransferase
MTDWIIRPAVEADLSAIMAIEHECFPEDAWSEDNMRFELLAHHTEYFVAVRNEQVIGYAGLSKVPSSDQGDVQTIAVLPAARGEGLGRALMDALITAAKRLHAGEIVLEVRADNPVAQALYVALGFEPVSYTHLTLPTK